MTARSTLKTAVALALVASAAAHSTAAGSSTAARPTLEITPRTIAYGTKPVVLTGVVPTRRAGEPVAILAHACRFTEPAEIATVRTGKGGVFRYRIQPMLNTSFSVEWKSERSRAVRVTVQPTIELRRLAAARYRVEVSTTNGVFQDGRRVVLQRQAGKRWVRIGAGVLERASDETQITVVSAVTISARVTPGTRLRALLPQARCYKAAASAPIS